MKHSRRRRRPSRALALATAHAGSEILVNSLRQVVGAGERATGQNRRDESGLRALAHCGAPVARWSTACPLLQRGERLRGEDHHLVCSAFPEVDLRTLVERGLAERLQVVPHLVHRQHVIRSCTHGCPPFVRYVHKVLDGCVSARHVLRFEEAPTPSALPLPVMYRGHGFTLRHGASSRLPVPAIHSPASRWTPIEDSLDRVAELIDRFELVPHPEGGY